MDCSLPCRTEAQASRQAFPDQFKSLRSAREAVSTSAPALRLDADTALGKAWSGVYSVRHRPLGIEGYTKKRGRWKSPASVRVYEKSAKLTRQLARMSAEQLAAARNAATTLPNNLIGRASAL